MMTTEIKIQIENILEEAHSQLNALTLVFIAKLYDGPTQHESFSEMTAVEAYYETFKEWYRIASRVTISKETVIKEVTKRLLKEIEIDLYQAMEDKLDDKVDLEALQSDLSFGLHIDYNIGPETLKSWLITK